MYDVVFWKRAGQDYLFFARHNNDIRKRIDELIENMRLTPFKGISKPEMFKGNLQGHRSRRIADKHRLVYRVGANTIYIYFCRGH